MSEKGDVQDFDSWAQFEAQEGKIMMHTILGDKAMLWTKDGTYTMSKKQWRVFWNTKPEEVERE